MFESVKKTIHETKTHEDFNRFLLDGPQTKTSPAIKEIAEKIDGSFEEKISKIFKYVHVRPVTNKNDVFRKRTADQIISDGYYTGCTDQALVFIAIARALKIPTKYLETLNLSFLQEEDSKFIDGHVYVSVFEDSKGWMIVNPNNGRTDVNIEKDNRVVLDTGLDSWDIGIKNRKDLRSKIEVFKKTYKNIEQTKE